MEGVWERASPFGMFECAVRASAGTAELAKSRGGICGVGVGAGGAASTSEAEAAWDAITGGRGRGCCHGGGGAVRGGREFRNNRSGIVRDELCKSMMRRLEVTNNVEGQRTFFQTSWADVTLLAVGVLALELQLAWIRRYNDARLWSGNGGRMRVPASGV
jgi:hypothetical protein